MSTNHNELENMKKELEEETKEIVKEEIKEILTDEADNEKNDDLKEEQKNLNSNVDLGENETLLEKDDEKLQEDKDIENEIESNSSFDENNNKKENEKKSNFSFVRILIIAILLLVIGILVFFRLNIKNEEVMQELPVVDVMTIGRGDIYNTVSVSGNILPKETYKVLTKTSGEITKIYVKNGDYVHYGDPICEIDNKKKIDSAFITYDTSKKQYERMKVLYNNGDISKQNFEQVKAQYDANKLAYETQVEFATPTATGDGYIENTNMTVGESKGQDALCCYITSNEGKKIQFSVTERAIKGINVGDNVVVEKSGKNYNATIYDKSSLMNEQTGLFDVKAIFNERNDLSQGIMAKVTSIYDESIDTLILPRQVIYYENEKPLVYTIDVDGTILTKFLTLGIETDDEVEVLSGVDERTKIISTWTSDLVDGTKVNVMATRIYVPLKKVGRRINEDIKVEESILESQEELEQKDEVIEINNAIVASKSESKEKAENIEETVDIKKIQDEVKVQQSALEKKETETSNVK